MPPPPAAIDELVVFPRLVRLLSRDPNRNRDRFYELRWDRSLVNDPVLVRSYDRVGTPGRVRMDAVTDEPAAQQLVRSLL